MDPMLNKVPMKTKFFILVFSTILLGSCVSTQTVSLQNNIDDKNAIEIYLDELNKPSKEYEIISYIEASGSVFANKNNLNKALKKNAKKLGGDAVINIKYFYIPWAFSSLPAAEGIVVKWKK